MTKVSKRLEFDWVSVVATFPDGAEAKVKWNRAGSTVTITPRDAALANRLSIIVDQALKIPNVTVRNIVDVFERIALGAETVQSLVSGLSADLGVSGEIKASAPGPDRTQVNVKASRGILVSGVFPSGERFELKINKSSIGLVTEPMVSARDSELMNMVFGIKNTGLYSDAEMAERFKQAAETSENMDQWIEEIRNVMRPGPRP